MVLISLRTAMFIRASTEKVDLKDSANTNGQMETSTKESSNKDKNMDKENGRKLPQT